MAGDGCGSTCLTESGWSCTAPPSTCTTICGDGILISPNEACDDGNTLSIDGCDSLCSVIEFGFYCTGAPSVCTVTCGDGKMASSELCDDSSDDGIGCLTGCSGPAVGYSCSGNFPTICN